MGQLPIGKTLLRQFRKAQAHYPDLTYEKHALMLGVPVHAYLARVYDEIELREKQPPFDLGQPLKLAGDWMLAGDWHIPFTDLAFVSLLLQVAIKQKIKKLILAGDIVNFDAFSNYADLVALPTWAQERDMARAIFHRLIEWFDEIVMLMGNHERRGQKWSLGAFDEKDVLALIVSNPERITSTPFGYCVITSPTGEWRVTHPKNYGINQLIVADQLAMKHQQHLISFHEHHLSLGWDRYGRYCIVNGGSLVDLNKLAYVALDDSKSAVMKNGFVMLRNGTPYLFGKEPVTDWSMWI